MILLGLFFSVVIDANGYSPDANGHCANGYDPNKKYCEDQTVDHSCLHGYEGPEHGNCPNGYDPDKSGWTCLGTNQSVYYSCKSERTHCHAYKPPSDCVSGMNFHYKVAQKPQYKTRWTCDQSDVFACNFGSPACLNGQCKDASQTCGTSWTMSPFEATCATVFPNLTKRARCASVFGQSGKICPLSAVSSDGMSYVGWANAMMSQEKVTSMVAAAALDTIWFYDKLKTEPVNFSHPADPVPASLVGADISAHFAVFRKFSCLRNIPQCMRDRPLMTNCENSCTNVTEAVTTWFTKCRTYGGVLCSRRSIGVRDCNGTSTGNSSGDSQKGLCSAFQNSPIVAVASSGFRQGLNIMMLVLGLLGFRFSR